VGCDEQPDVVATREDRGLYLRHCEGAPAGRGYMCMVTQIRHLGVGGAR
jgi:hypothetical protein